MTKRFLCRAIFLRHGQSDYTGDLPDLTSDGVETIRKSAIAIEPLTIGFKEVAIVSSPTPRAFGSADIIARKLGYKKSICQEPALQAAVVKDMAIASALFKEHAKNGDVRKFYMTNPCYEDSCIIEPRSEVRKRFFCYFTKMIRYLLINLSAPLCVIHVCHYENLYHLVEYLFELDFAKDEPLECGEIIVISIYYSEEQNTIEVTACFRGRKSPLRIFNCKEKAFQ